MMKAIYTICSPSHIAESKALIASAKKHNPDIHCFIYMFNGDAFAKQLFEGFEEAELLIVEDMQIPDLEAMKTWYNSFELSTALKGYLAYHILFDLNRGVEQVIFLDSDMMVFNSFKDTWKDLESRDLVLSYHINCNTVWPNDPIAVKARKSTELNMLRGGTFNGGFFALNKNEGTRKYLAWWRDVLTKGAFNRPSKGLFTEQLWHVMVPVLFNDLLHVNRDPGYNAAYWNLDERKLELTENGYYVTTVDGERSPLVFFHLSGYRLHRQNMISIYHVDQYTFDMRPELKPLFEAYKNMLIKYDHDIVKVRYAPPRKWWKKLLGLRK